MNVDVNVYIFMMIVGCFKQMHTQDLELNIIANKNGYPVEVHEIETEDGYLLDIYRIPHGRRSSIKKTNIYPVILCHGLMGSAEVFIIMGPEKSLAYMLADNGYDVWLCNVRGTRHSRKHKTLNPDSDAEFWNFSWHEIGIYDLPAVVDHVLKVTNTNKVHYVAHSQGTTSFFVMCSERPEYNKRIKLMIAMAPSAIFRHFKHPILQMIIPYRRFLEKLADDLKEYEFPPFISNKNIRALNTILCGNNQILPDSICNAIFFILFDTSEINKNISSFLMANVPAGASIKQLVHYGQIIESGKFRKFDFGSKANTRKYNSKTPPQYRLQSVTVPIAIFYGESDNFIAVEDVMILTTLLPNIIKVYKLPNKEWTHYDFMFNKDIDILLNNEIIDTINKNDH